MKIAVTSENGSVFQHFGRTPEFCIVEVGADGLIGGMNTVPTGETGHGALAGFLKERGVDVLICGGIGGGARQALEEAGIKLVGGASGDAIQAVGDYLKGELKTNPDFACNHHHDDSEHSCGTSGHSCGSSGCGHSHNA